MKSLSITSVHNLMYRIGFYACTTVVIFSQPGEHLSRKSLINRSVVEIMFHKKKVQGSLLTFRNVEAQWKNIQAPKKVL